MLQIEVTDLDGKQVEVNILADKKVADLKHELEKMQGVLIVEQMLVEADTILEDDTCLRGLQGRVTMVREELQAGTVVELHSLKAFQYNGCRGRVIGARKRSFG